MSVTTDLRDARLQLAELREQLAACRDARADEAKAAAEALANANELAADLDRERHAALLDLHAAQDRANAWQRKLDAEQKVSEKLREEVFVNALAGRLWEQAAKDVMFSDQFETRTKLIGDVVQACQQESSVRALFTS
jgi:hypothetical protein